MEDWWLMLLHHFYSTTRGRPRKVLRVQIFSRFLLRATAMASEREAAPRLRMMAEMCCLTADAEMPQAAAIVSATGGGMPRLVYAEGTDGLHSAWVNG